jgi:hypothetical protein
VLDFAETSNSSAPVRLWTMALGRLLTISSLTIISGEVPGLAETFTIRYKIVSPYADLDCL